jgi:F420-dependent oxidoreductase-like protein
MRLGLTVSRFTWPGGPERIGATFGEIARQAEAGGLASLWVMDHFFQIEMNGPPELDMLEAYTTLGFAAASTSRISLGALVTGAVYRHPGVLVKTVTTLDVLSGGRAYLGIGAAWFDGEARALGIPFPPLAERFERLEETLRVARQMWAGDESPFHGRYYQLERPLNAPQALSRPRPPILIGGSGERKTLRLVAKYADATNLFESPELPHKLRVLRAHCDREGRPYQEIEKTVLTRLPLPSAGGSLDDAVKQAQRLAELGVDHVIMPAPPSGVPAALDDLAEVASRISSIVPAGR